MREQNAYSELYIEDAMCNMANLVDYVVNDLHRDPDEFFKLFEASGIAREFSHGNPKYVSAIPESIFYLRCINKRYSLSEKVLKNMFYKEEKRISTRCRVQKRSQYDIFMAVKKANLIFLRVKCFAIWRKSLYIDKHSCLYM
mgnify:CR=1 FL=1